MSLATKYRPKTFDDVVEQPVIVDCLRNMCNQEVLENRNLLLIGPAGTGKTSSARLISNALNGCNSEPIEIDAASNNGVDYMRDIVQQAKSYPIGVKYKTIIVDEAHSLSNQAWQCLLKVLEESPARTVFIFCTTNPEKIPATVISRLQVFRLSKISLDGIYNRLKYVLDQEQIQYEDDAVLLIAKLAQGGMRDALTMLDRVLAYTDKITSEDTEKALNLPSYNDFFDLLGAFAKHDNSAITKILYQAYNGDSNYINWLEAFQAFVVNVMSFIYLQDINKTSIPSHYKEKLMKYTDAHAFVCIKLSNVLMQMFRDIKTSSYQYEVSLSYLCHPKTPKGAAQ